MYFFCPSPPSHHPQTKHQLLLMDCEVSREAGTTVHDTNFFFVFVFSNVWQSIKKSSDILEAALTNGSKLYGNKWGSLPDEWRLKDTLCFFCGWKKILMVKKIGQEWSRKKCHCVYVSVCLSVCVCVSACAVSEIAWILFQSFAAMTRVWLDPKQDRDQLRLQRQRILLSPALLLPGHGFRLEWEGLLEHSGTPAGSVCRRY